jgi:hypothetical protein
MTDEKDIDLQDLIQDGEPASSSVPSSNPDQKYSNYYNVQNAAPQNNNKIHVIFRLPQLICFLLTSFFLQNPLLGKITVLSFLGLIIFTLLSLTSLNGKGQSIGVIKYDFTSVHSQYDFDIGKVDHWCVGGGNKCECPDPLHPSPRLHKAWFKAVQHHKELIGKEPNPDIVFVGQTLVEAMNARINGHDMSKSEYFGKVKQTFNSKFQVTGEEVTEDTGGDVDGGDHLIKATALGLTGDSASNVLWRLMNGELPDDFNPPIWWLVVGMEDVGRYGCSEEITVMGILRIVEEIKKKRPNAKIVVNSLLPMIKMRMAEADDEEEFVDAERGNGKGPKPKDGKNKRRKKRDGRVRYLKGGDSVSDESEESNTNSDESDEVSEEKKQRRDKMMKKRMKDLEQRKRKYMQQVKHDKFNPKMKDVKKWKKKGRNSDTRIPMWTAVHTINKELHKFCQRTPHVTFFDATSIFAMQGEDGDGGYVMSTELISPRGHPTLKGFKKWFEAVSKQSQEWKKKMVHAETEHADDKSYKWNLNGDDYYQHLEEESKKFYPEGSIGQEENDHEHEHEHASNEKDEAAEDKKPEEEESEGGGSDGDEE